VSQKLQALKQVAGWIFCNRSEKSAAVNFIQKKLWIAWSKFRFLRLPVEKRVRLEVTTDGRHLTFLLVSLYEAGYGVQVVGSPAVFRELICLRKSVPIPFLYGGKERDFGISISDKSGFNHRVHNRAPGQVQDGATIGWPQGRESESDRVIEHEGGKRVFLDYDFFSVLTTKRHESEVEELTTESTEDTEIDGRLRLESQASASELDSLTSKLARAPVSESLIRFSDGPTSALDTGHLLPTPALRAPYFMHPSVYHRGLHKRRSPSTALDSAAKQRRRFRIGFFGTHDREFYTKHYHFPGMNRFEILEVFLQRFGNRMKRLRGFPRDWDPCEMAVSIDGRGGDRRGKTFLSQDHYLEALRECDFVLSPPGWCMPVSHNLVEAIFCGAIPITNGGAFMAEPLADGINSLEFQNVEGLVAVIERALAMDECEVVRMRDTVRDYYDQFLDPKAFAEAFVHTKSRRILVNAEENSAPLVFPDFSRLTKLNT
jgi:hypothetical protein